MSNPPNPVPDFSTVRGSRPFAITSLAALALFVVQLLAVPGVLVTGTALAVGAVLFVLLARAVIRVRGELADRIYASEGAHAVKPSSPGTDPHGSAD